MTKPRKIVLTLVTLLCVQLVQVVQPVAASEIRSKSSVCKTSEVWKSRKKGSQVCIEVNGKRRWVKTLDKQSVVTLSNSCPPLINERDRDNACKYFNDLGLYVVSLSLPKAQCVAALQLVLNKISEIYNAENGETSEEISKEVDNIIVTGKCARVF